jgi:hypothetical protein
VQQDLRKLQGEGAHPKEYDGATIRDRFALPYPSRAPASGE